jgi:hypothetical protein
VPKAGEVIVRIVSAPANLSTAALAETWVSADVTAGSVATVYVDRVRTLATAGGVDAGTLMGRAIAHEIGHLLLGAAHSRSGVMRPVWSAPVVRVAGARAWTFSDREAARLRKNLSDRFDSTTDTRIALAEPHPSPTPCPKTAAILCGQNE